MFHHNKATNLNLSSFDTSNVTLMGWMFAHSLAINIDLSSFDTSNVTDMQEMFHNSQLKSLVVKFDSDIPKYKKAKDFPAKVNIIFSSPNKYQTANVCIRGIDFKGQICYNIGI